MNATILTTLVLPSVLVAAAIGCSSGSVGGTLLADGGEPEAASDAPTSDSGDAGEPSDTGGPGDAGDPSDSGDAGDGDGDLPGDGATCGGFAGAFSGKCWECSEAKACSAKAACFSDTSCRALAGCVAACYLYGREDQSCRDSCMAEQPLGAGTYGKLMDTLSLSCSSECSGTETSVSAHAAGWMSCDCGGPYTDAVPSLWASAGHCDAFKCHDGGTLTLQATLPNPLSAYMLLDLTAHQASGVAFGGNVGNGPEVYVSWKGVITNGHKYAFVAWGSDSSNACYGGTPVARVELGPLSGDTALQINASATSPPGSCELLTPFAFAGP